MEAGFYKNQPPFPVFMRSPNEYLTEIVACKRKMK